MKNHSIKTLPCPTFEFSRSFLLLMIVVGLLMVMPDAFAQLPSGDDLKIPGVDGSAPWYQQIGAVIIFGVAVMFFGGLLFGLAQSVISLFKLISDARESNDWGKVVTQIIIILIIVAFVFALFYLANKFGFGPFKEYLGIK